MAARFIFFVTVQTILLQTTFSQCLNRVLPGCGPNVVEAVLPNQFLVRENGLPLIPGPAYPSQVISGPVIPGSLLPGSLLPGSVLPGSVLPGSVLPGSVLPGSVLPGSVLPGSIVPGPVLSSPVLSELGYPQTIIQDSSVANSLANALQLLVVSSLLSNTLPGPCDACPIDVPYAMPAYNYVY